ncbi:MAG: chromate transporter [Metamycoplasmataceae bacterium]
MLALGLSALIVLLGCFIISIVVFGGAQVFIPYFKILLVNVLGIDLNTWENLLSITNATPGIFGLKLALASGYLAAQGHWWGYLLMFGTYFIFTLVPIFMMTIVMKKYNKIKQTKFMVLFLKIMRPVLSGILISVVLSLLMSLVVPFIGFNDLGSEFSELDKYLYFKEHSFFKEWRYWVLLTWSIISIPADFVIIRKYKTNIIFLIITNIVLCMLLFAPWIT